MRTTLDINDATLSAIRKHAAMTGRSLREVVNEILMLGLAQLSKPKKRRAFRVETHALELKPGFHGVSLNQLYDQIEAEQDARRG